jgi:Skp family chaperone for outer membrane proteins
MKKFIALVLALFFIGSAALASTGFIDVQKVFREYRETKKAQAELGKKEDAFKKEFEASQKKLQKAELDGKSRSDLENMKKEMEKKLAPKRDNLLKLNEQLTVKLQQKILDSVKKVAKKLGIDLVLDKQVVITGGMDLTEMVVNELNK